MLVTLFLYFFHQSYLLGLYFKTFYSCSLSFGTFMPIHSPGKLVSSCVTPIIIKSCLQEDCEYVRVHLQVLMSLCMPSTHEFGHASRLFTTRKSYTCSGMTLASNFYVSHKSLALICKLAAERYCSCYDSVSSSILKLTISLCTTFIGEGTCSTFHSVPLTTTRALNH